MPSASVGERFSEVMAHHGGTGRGVSVRCVHPEQGDWHAEAAEHGDLLYVDGRERLPNVGVVTEKSAYFWRDAASIEPATKWYCK